MATKTANEQASEKIAEAKKTNTPEAVKKAASEMVDIEQQLLALKTPAEHRGDCRSAETKIPEGYEIAGQTIVERNDKGMITRILRLEKIVNEPDSQQ